MEHTERRAKKSGAQKYDMVRILRMGYYNTRKYGKNISQKDWSDTHIVQLVNKKSIIHETRDKKLLRLLYHNLKGYINGSLKDQELQIITVPRFKCSEASGNEWRISHDLKIINDGIDSKRDDIGYDTIDNVLSSISEYEHNNNDDNKISDEHLHGKGNLCDQEGCSDESNVTYKLKNTWVYEDESNIDDGKWISCDGFKVRNRSTSGWVKIDPYSEEDKRPLIRKFCDRHSTRGNVGQEDKDENYEILNGNGPVEPLYDDKAIIDPTDDWLNESDDDPGAWLDNSDDDSIACP